MSKHALRFFFMAMALFPCATLYAQEKHELSAHYAWVGDAALLVYGGEPIGIGSRDSKSVDSFGINYTRFLTTKFALKTGVSYVANTFEVRGAPMGTPLPTRVERLDVLSIPLEIEFYFWKYLFANGGLGVDIDVSGTTTGHDALDNQTGLGVGLGIGGQYMFDNGLRLFANPFIRQYATLKFEKDHHKLSHVGLKLGVGYRF